MHPKWLGYVREHSVRFQTEDTIDTSDQTLVLGALERSVVRISLNVVRADGELRVYGIGPSPRPVNVRNLTVFRVEGAEQGRTRVKVESEFLASSLLEGSAQEPAVREKIDRALDLAKEEVALRRRTLEQTSVPMAESTDSRLHAPAEPAPHVSAAFQSQAARADSLLPIVPETAPISKAQPAAATATLYSSVDSAGPAFRLHQETNQNGRPETVGRHASSDQLHRGDGEQPTFRQAPPRYLRRETVWWKLAIPVTVLLLVMAAYLFGRWQRPGRDVAPIGKPPKVSVTSPELRKESPVSSQTREVPAVAVGKTSAQTPATVRGGTRERFPVAEARQWQARAAIPQNSGGGVPSLASTSLLERLDEWAASMRSTDAAVQASFYANHLDRYFLKTDVNHIFVLRDKQDFLRRGNRVDLFRVEDVQVKDRTDSSARLRLLKHYVMHAGQAAPAVERIVRSELSFRKIDGKWEITEERDFR